MIALKLSEAEAYIVIEGLYKVAEKLRGDELDKADDLIDYARKVIDGARQEQETVEQHG